MQSVILYFIRKYNYQLSQFGSSFLKKLLHNDFISEKFLQDWYDNLIHLDNKSILHDKLAEKKFRILTADVLDQYSFLTSFDNWNETSFDESSSCKT